MSSSSHKLCLRLCFLGNPSTDERRFPGPEKIQDGGGPPLCRSSERTAGGKRVETALPKQGPPSAKCSHLRETAMACGVGGRHGFGRSHGCCPPLERGPIIVVKDRSVGRLLSTTSGALQKENKLRVANRQSTAGPESQEPACKARRKIYFLQLSGSFCWKSGPGRVMRNRAAKTTGC